MHKEAKIFSLAMISDSGQYLVTLEETSGTRLLPIWIGPAEGMAIAAALQNQSFPRPLTHDLIAGIINELGAKVEQVIITDLKDDTFFASLVLSLRGQVYNIDARPSDSIAIALRCNAGIFIDQQVFDKCPPIYKPITDNEVQMFKKQLEHLRPEDFFREKKDG